MLVTVRTLRRAAPDAARPAAVPRSQAIAALALALCSFALAWVAVAGPLPASLVKSPLAPSELAALVTTIAVGTLIALAFAREAPFAAGAGAVRALRAACTPVGRALEAIDYTLRGWSVAGLSLLVITLAFALLMRASA